MREDACPAQYRRDDVATEVVAGRRVGRVALQHLEHEGGVEDTDAHAGQRPSGPAGHGARPRRLLVEGDDALLRVHRHHAEAAGLFDGHLDAGDGELGAARHVVGQQHRIVHLVDVVAGQHHHAVGMRLAHQVQVLEHRVGGAAGPGLAGLLLRRHDVDELTEAGFQEAPAALDVTDQRLRLVLRQHADAPQPRVDAVAEREVDDAHGAGKGHCRLGAVVGQAGEAAAAAAGEHQCVGVAAQGQAWIGVHGARVAGRAGVAGSASHCDKPALPPG